jgi:endonuclease/exonuclease/phosphatase (EEP) superfamily protein YafD
MSAAESNGIGRSGGRPPRLRRLAPGLVCALLAITAAPFLRPVVPPLGLFEHFAAQLAALCALAAIAAWFLKRRLWAALAGLVLLWNLLTVAPFLDLQGWVRGLSGRGATAAQPSQAPLKVVSLNVWYKHADHQPAIDYLLKSDADVIGLVEVNPSWLASLKALEAAYPYHLDCVMAVPNCGVAIYSKQPFLSGFAGRIGESAPSAVTVSIDRGGKPLTITEIQIVNPLSGGERRQAAQARMLGDYLAKLSGDQLVMGDFNSAPWSRLQGNLRAATGLDNSGRLAFTWPSWAPALFRIPIDQVFIRGDIAVRDYRPGPAVGSDHLPITAEIVAKP